MSQVGFEFCYTSGLGFRLGFGAVARLSATPSGAIKAQLTGREVLDNSLDVEKWEVNNRSPFVVNLASGGVYLMLRDGGIVLVGLLSLDWKVGFVRNPQFLESNPTTLERISPVFSIAATFAELCERSL